MPRGKGFDWHRHFPNLASVDRLIRGDGEANALTMAGELRCDARTVFRYLAFLRYPNTSPSPLGWVRCMLPSASKPLKKNAITKTDGRFGFKLSVAQILAWADAYHRRTETWPRRSPEPIPGASGGTWFAIDSALRKGLRGLPAGSS
jgi:hypothetical protein